MQGFLKRNNLSYRVCTAERRPPIDQKEVDTFNKLLQKAIDDTSDRIILNCDESCWRVMMPPKRSIVKRGQDSVKLNIDGDQKAGFTIIGTISSDGAKLPLVIIAKGRTKRCHKQLGKHPNFSYKVFHSEKGWTTEAVFSEYLEWIRCIIGEKKISLVVDQWGPHFGPKAAKKAEDLDIHLIPVPKGGTSVYQPLDRKIFAIMKKKGAAKWVRMCHNNPRMKWTKSTATAIALQCWEEIKEHHILSAWKCKGDPSGSESESSDSCNVFIPERRKETNKFTRIFLRYQ